MTKFSTVSTLCVLCVPTSIAFMAVNWLPSSDLIKFQPSHARLQDNDLIGYNLKFVEPGFQKFEVFAGASTIFSLAVQFLVPTSLKENLGIQKNSFQRVYDKLNSRPVDILDARTRDVGFKDSGFDLMNVEGVDSLDWDTPDALDRFKNLVEPHLKKLYPSATRFMYNNPTHRATGRSGFAAIQRRVIDVPHTDYSPIDEDWEEFDARYPDYHDGQIVKRAFLGKEDTDSDEFRIILGMWLPTRMRTPVCDSPLILMDARSGSLNETTTVETHIQIPGNIPHHLISLISYNEAQKWYYYPYQKSNEVLVWHHYNKYDKTYWSNPHTGIYNSHCSDDYESRSSTEFRLAVFFPKSEKKRIATIETQ